MRFPWLVVLAPALFFAGCGGNSTTSPSDTTTTPSVATERFDAILEPGNAAFYSFTVSAAGSVSINLASLSPLDRPGLLPAAMELGYGVPEGEECTVTKSIQTVPGLTSQLVDTLTNGTYCANLRDIGNLKQPVNFSMRITHP
jgi:hypothetical protein